MLEHRIGPFAPDVSPERSRVRLALMRLAVERGIPNVTVEMVCEEARVERDLFEREFGDVESCCQQVYIANIAEFDRLVFGAADRADGWPARLRAAAYAAFHYLQDRPVESHFNFIEMLEAGEEAQVYRDRYVQRIVDLIDEGRAEAEDQDGLGRDVALAAFGSVYEFLARKFQQGEDPRTFERYVPELMHLAVQPYLGEEAARAELSIPAPEPLRDGTDGPSG
jgi:AcrR family transcriptional regulator